MNRLISLCTVFLLLTSFLVPCAFAEDVNLSDAYNFELINALDIDKDINKADSEAITRAEFTAMAVRSLNMNGLGAYDGSFSDVPEDAPFAYEIYMAKSLRMTNGTSEGIFSPDAEVSGNVALKMLLTAMGYETVAQARGGYPTGYVVLDRTLGILKGISYSDVLTVYDAKVIITNALKADMAIFSGIENEHIIVSTSGGRTLLSERFGFEKVSGIVDVAGFITYDNTVTEDDAISLAGKNFKSRIDATPYFGMDVTAYHKDGEVYAVEANDNNKIVIVDAEEVGAFSSNILTTYNSDKEYRYRISPSLSFIKNGRLISHTNDSFKFNHGNLKLIDNDSDNIYDIVIAESVEYYVISGINHLTSTIYDNNSSIGPITFGENSNYEGSRLIDASGNIVDVNTLSTDEVVLVMRSDDRKICIVRSGGSKTLSGRVEEITTEGYVVNGEEYIPNTYFISRGIDINVGNEYTFLLASDKTITTTIGDGSNGISYGFLVDVTETQGLSAGTLVKLLVSDGDVKVFALADKIILDGERGVLRTDAKVASVLYNGEYPKYQLIRYRTNKDGFINLIDTSDGVVNSSWDVEQTISNDDSLTQYASMASVNFRSGSDFGAPHFSFKNSIIFAVPKDLQTKVNVNYGDNLFTVKSADDLFDNTTYISDAYDFDSSYYPRATVIYTETTDAVDRIRSDRDSHIVYAVSDVSDKEGNITKSIRTYSKGLYHSYIINHEKIESLKTSSKLPAPGDIVRFELDKNGYIHGISIDAKYNVTNKKPDIKYTSGAVTGYVSYISGVVKTIGNGQITLDTTNEVWTPGTTSRISKIAPVPIGNASYTIYNTKTQEVSKGVITDIMTETSVGVKNASKVLCRISYYSVVEIFIYTE